MDIFCNVSHYANLTFQWTKLLSRIRTSEAKSSSEAASSSSAAAPVETAGGDDEDDDDRAERQRRPLLSQRRREADKTGRGRGSPPLGEMEEDENPPPSE